MSYEIKATFAKNLTDLCNEKGMPEHGRQAEIARLCGIKPSSVNKWFNAVSLPDADNLLKLSEWGNTSVDWLLYGKGLKHGGYATYDKSTQHVLQVMQQLDEAEKYKAARMLDLLTEPETLKKNGTS